MRLVTGIQKYFPRFFEWLQFPSFCGWLSFCSGIVLQQICTIPLFNVPIFYNEAIVFSIIFFGICALFIRPIALKCLLLVIAGYVCMTMSWNEQKKVYHDASVKIKNCPTSILTGTIVSQQTMFSNGKYVYLVKTDSLNGSFGAVFKNKNLLFYTIKNIPFRSSIKANGKFSIPIPKQNPGAYDDYLNCISNDIWGRFFADSIEYMTGKTTFSDKIRFFISATLTKACSHFKNNEYKGIIIASLVNDKSELSDDMKQLFFKAGIYHLLALSGFNVAIFAAMLLFFLSFFPINRLIKTLIIIGFIWSFYGFIGSLPSLFRAVVMTTIVLAAYLFQRKPYALNSLGLAGMIWLLFSPLSLYTVSYQLSFCATFGLISLFPVLQEHFSLKHNSFLTSRVLNPLISVSLVSISAFIATVPVLCYHFGTISFAGIIANLFSVWLMSMAMICAIAGFIFQIIMPFLTGACMGFSELLIALMIYLCSIVEVFPFAIIQSPHFHPTIYIVFSVFIIFICVIKVSKIKATIFIGLFAVIIISTAIFFVDKHFSQPTITAFYVKNDNLWGIRWPDNSLSIAGYSSERQRNSTFNMIITPWINTNYNNCLSSVLLSNSPCNSIHFLEPMLKGAHVKTIYALPQEKKCGYFQCFLNEYKADLITVSPNDVVPVGSHASFSFLGGNTVFVKTGINNLVQIFEDSAHTPTAKTGAIIYSFQKNSPIRPRQFVSQQHPAYGFLE